jgi:3-deoxy-7-phosphoheptulonate synthase
MIIVLKPEATKQDADLILQRIEELGLKPLCMPGSERIVLGALGDERCIERLHLENHPIVESVKPILSPYKMVSRDFRKENTVVKLGEVEVGGPNFVVIAGPCAVEGLDEFREAAGFVAKAGATALRGGAYKPRTSPYSFQGLGLEGLRILKTVSEETGLPTVTEVMDIADVPAVEEHAAAFQVGARNMQNFRLLTALGKSRKPVILKRGMAAKAEDLLLAAEYILAEGNPNVILCERGIKTFETATRNTLDLNAIPYLKQKSHLPVIVDPSHGTGIRDFVAPLAKAAVGVGADGLMIEAHQDPSRAMSDGQQSLYPEQFAKLMKELKPFVEAAGKSLA